MLKVLLMTGNWIFLFLIMDLFYFRDTQKVMGYTGVISRGKRKTCM